MLWLKHYAKANSLVVFFKGRLTVLQINGSHPSLQLAASLKKKLGEQTRVLQYVHVGWKHFYIWIARRVSAWLRGQQMKSFQGTDKVTHRKHVFICNYNYNIINYSLITAMQVLLVVLRAIIGWSRCWAQAQHHREAGRSGLGGKLCCARRWAAKLPKGANPAHGPALRAFNM